ncbi:MAG: cryptochrome/photolyase family protein [Gemmatimonadaceae bacterium]|nr:cryptochrome/photolyase family protein [Acetobacteraceae bacterium]
MTTLRIVLGDQCSAGLSALDGLDPAVDVVLMSEVMGECTYVKHHPKKIVLVLSAMRHFAKMLQEQGIRVDYVRLDDPENTGSLRGEMLRAVARHTPSLIAATEPGEWRLSEDMRRWQEVSGIETDIRDDNRFLCRIQEFRTWARDRGAFRMEFFYREMRRRYGLLMDDGAPAGGKWNYDPENRKPLPKGMTPPPVPQFPPDAITQEVMDLVARVFPSHFGAVDGFGMPVTHADAAVALQDFVTQRLPLFGDWQDTMKTGEGTMYHALISTSLNTGLLSPLEACQAAEAAWRAGRAPLNAVEGFVRQILGWREFVRGVYWLKMPEYGALNSLNATRALPAFYWTAETRMNCLHQAIGDTRRHAYAHHIQRLMITGNFALLAGLHPDEVDEWYLIVYADAYEWVEMPNVRGMALHADGGIIGSKPYASSGAYINRMSDYCRGCHYDVKDAVGERGCPFNALYWDFIARHGERFGQNPRMAMPVRTLAKMDGARVAAIRARAAGFLTAMDAGEMV